MKLIPTFTSACGDDGIWSVRLGEERHSEFDKFFDRMNDVEWLYDFFEKNKEDLISGFFGTINIRNAVFKTLSEIEEMEDLLYDYAEQGFTDGKNNLQHLFKPLNNHEYVITAHQKSKARIRQSWLRIYAVRLAQNCYLVTGGAIKLTRNMDRHHLQQELNKLKKTQSWLCEAGVDYPEDLNQYTHEQ